MCSSHHESPVTDQRLRNPLATVHKLGLGSQFLRYARIGRQCVEVHGDDECDK